jgi:DNA-binding response OmpR family regulator
MTDREGAERAQGGPETVLLVDPEILVRMALAEYLRECGYRVVEAANSDEARLVLEQGRRRIDMLLVDVAVPGSSDGFALAQWARTHKAGLPVILVGSVERAADVAGDLCEDGPMLNKPYDHQILLDRIKRLLAEHTRDKRR